MKETFYEQSRTISETKKSFANLGIKFKCEDEMKGNGLAIVKPVQTVMLYDESRHNRPYIGIVGLCNQVKLSFSDETAIFDLGTLMNPVTFTWEFTDEEIVTLINNGFYENGYEFSSVFRNEIEVPVRINLAFCISDKTGDSKFPIVEIEDNGNNLITCDIMDVDVTTLFMRKQVAPKENLFDKIKGVYTAEELAKLNSDLSIKKQEQLQRENMQDVQETEEQEPSTSPEDKKDIESVYDKTTEDATKEEDKEEETKTNDLDNKKEDVSEDKSLEDKSSEGKQSEEKTNVNETSQNTGIPKPSSASEENSDKEDEDSRIAREAYGAATDSAVKEEYDEEDYENIDENDGSEVYPEV